MRWVAHSMILNEELYCFQSISSVYDFVEQLVIIESAVPFAYHANFYGLSSDHSAEIIRDFPDPEHKIRFVQAGWVPSKRELRSMSFSLLDKKPGDGILILDLDEIWDTDDLKRADEHFSSDPSLLYLHCDLIQLRGDFEHYRDMSTGEQEHDLYNEQAKKKPIDTRNKVQLREGRTAERLFRYENGMHYVSHVTICDAMGRYPYIDPFYLNRREADMSIKFWHYNYLKPFPQVFTKFCYFAQQDANKKRNDPEMVQRALSEGYIEYLRTGKHPKGDWAVSPLPAHLKHPVIMEKHPYRLLSEKAIVDPFREWIPQEGPYDMDKIMVMLEEASRYTAPANIQNMVPKR